MGLITPEDIVNEIKDIDYKDPGLNNLEGFTRQVIGWREFIRYMNLKNYDQFLNTCKKLTSKLKAKMKSLSNSYYLL